MRVFFRCVIAGRPIRVPAHIPGETDRYVERGKEAALYVADSEHAVFAEKLKHIEQEQLPFDPAAEFDLGSADADVSALHDLTDADELRRLGIVADELLQDASVAVPPSVAFAAPRRLWADAIANGKSGILASSAAYQNAEIIAIRASHIDSVLSDFAVKTTRIPPDFVNDTRRRRGEPYK